MTVSRRANSRRRWPISPVAAVMAVLGVLVLGFVIFAVKHGSGPVAGAGTTPGYTAPIATPTPSAATLKQLASNQVLILGDSWTVGTGADQPSTQGWAHIAAKDLGWSAVIDGFSGAGYARSNGGTFAQFWATAAVPSGFTPALIVMQGSVNDQLVSPDLLPDAFAAALKVVKSRFPDAQLIAVGPAAQTTQQVPTTTTIDTVMQGLALNAHVPFINPMTMNWFPTAQMPTLINHAAGDHPSVAGHQLFAEKFEQAFKALSS